MPHRLLRFHRILCVTLRSSSLGHAVLDGFGVAEGSFFTTRLDRLRPAQRAGALVRLVRSSCRRFHATQVVLGLPGPRGAERRALADRIAVRLRRIRGVTVSIRRLRDGARLLVDRLRYTMAGEIVDRLVQHFVPELLPYAARVALDPRYWRAAWYAVAIALVELVEQHPLDAAALARPSAFTLQPFREALRVSCARLPASL